MILDVLDHGLTSRPIVKGKQEVVHVRGQYSLQFSSDGQDVDFFEDKVLPEYVVDQDSSELIPEVLSCVPTSIHCNWDYKRSSGRSLDGPDRGCRVTSSRDVRLQT